MCSLGGSNESMGILLREKLSPLGRLCSAQASLLFQQILIAAPNLIAKLKFSSLRRNGSKYKAVALLRVLTGINHALSKANQTGLHHQGLPDWN